MAGAGTIGLPFARTFRPSPAHAAGAFTYNPAARFDLAVSKVELRRNSAARMLMARIYQPKGPGPFPTVLDLHGGAWNRKDRFAEEPMDRGLAASGLLVVAVVMTLAPEAPYPACVQDALERNRSLDPDTVHEILTSSAKPLAPGRRNDQYGWGLVDPAKALLDIDTQLANDRQKNPAKAAAPKPGTLSSR
jgi:hypothetical protein